MTTPLFLLRCKQLGLSLSELDLLTIGIINDMFTEQENDDADYSYVLVTITKDIVHHISPQQY